MNQYFITTDIVWTYHSLFIYLSVDGHLCCLHFPTIINNTAIGIYAFLIKLLFSVLLNTPISGSFKSYGTFYV